MCPLKNGISAFNKSVHHRSRGSLAGILAPVAESRREAAGRRQLLQVARRQRGQPEYHGGAAGRPIARAQQAGCFDWSLLANAKF